jgi:hypothetical protein
VIFHHPYLCPATDWARIMPQNGAQANRSKSAGKHRKHWKSEIWLTSDAGFERKDYSADV